MQLSIDYHTALHQELYPNVHAMLYEVSEYQGQVTITMSVNEDGRYDIEGVYSYKTDPATWVRECFIFCQANDQVQGAMVAVALFETLPQKYVQIIFDLNIPAYQQMRGARVLTAARLMD